MQKKFLFSRVHFAYKDRRSLPKKSRMRVAMRFMRSESNCRHYKMMRREGVKNILLKKRVRQMQKGGGTMARTKGEAFIVREGKEPRFSAGTAIAEMLSHGVIFLVEGLVRAREDDDPELPTVILTLNCNDLFYWGTADSRLFEEADIRPMYEAWISGGKWGLTKWTCLRYKEPPMPEIIRDMKKEGAWCNEMVKAFGSATKQKDNE